MKIEELSKNLFFIKFKNQLELASTFIRLQEFYESQYEEIHGKYFTVEQYTKLYVKDRGKFDYYEVWSGFNLPSRVVRRFMKVFNGKLMKKEKDLLRFLEVNGVFARKKFYIIAGASYNVVEHEKTHGYYYLNRDYRREIDETIAKLPYDFLYRLQTSLLMKGYAVSVLKDETQAYCIDFAIARKNTLVGFEWKDSDLRAVQRIYDIFSRYNKYDERYS